MDLALQLEVGAHALTAVLGVWLGLTVAARSGVPAARIFAFLALTLAAWSSAIIVERLSTTPEAVVPARAIEELTVALALGGTAHFSLAIATDGHPTRRQRWIVAGLYLALIAFALPTVADPRLPVSVTPPHFSAGPIPGQVVGLASVLVRVVTLGFAVSWLVRAARAADTVPFRRRQIAAALATVVTGGLGAALRFLPVIGEADAWIGVSFVALAVVLATYAVFSAGIFFGPTIAGRAFRTSMLGGLVLFALVAVLVVVDDASRRYLGLEAPLFTALGIIVAIALYEPVAARVRRVADGGGPRAIARQRLLRALGQPALTARPAAAGVGPALARIGQALDLTGLAVVGPDGAVLASHGEPVWSGTVPPAPLVAGGEVLGELRVGPTASGAPIGDRDRELLGLSASYVAAALLTSQREDDQVRRLASLAKDRESVESQATALHAALATRRDGPGLLRVFALGPLRVERGDTRIERWGGDKAGTRQAQALFAFLLDRGERGVAKDEVLELIWPDVDLERADLAFHRTLRGLRATLDPGKSAGDGGYIRFGNDRYRLDEAIVAWSDVDAFIRSVEGVRDAADDRDRLQRLEEARTLYRGDYLDDCPIYGDSAHVETRREELRGRFLDVLMALAALYEARGDRLSAAAMYRIAVERSPGGFPPASERLGRLGL